MNIAMFFDGTWSDSSDRTMVSRIWDRVSSRDSDGGEQSARYVAGVGTGAWNRFLDGILGRGLDENIIEGYRFITGQHRSDDDRIYLCGFSRGAFSARSLAGMITKCGLIDSDILSAEKVFDRYRRKDAPGLREMQAGEKPAASHEDRLVLERSRLVRIRFIGVFETIGSLGIPGGIGRLLARGRYEFHDTALSGLVDIACHAVAIDEQRQLFTPTLWTSAPKPIEGRTTQIEQRWFVGSHSNVGGGNAEASTIDPLSLIAGDWMADSAVAAGLALDPPATSADGDEWRGPIEDSYNEFIGGVVRLLSGNGRYLRPVRTTVGETLDDSVLRRWGTGRPPYRPRNPNLASWVQMLKGQPQT